MQIASHNPNIIIQSIQPKHHKIFRKNKKGGGVRGNRRFPGLKGGGVRGTVGSLEYIYNAEDLKIKFVYLS